jgi:5-methylcytosine-specific restriction protein A
MAMPRQEFSSSVKREAKRRAGGKCEGCGSLLVLGKFHYDHIIADGAGGQPTLANCALLCLGCHGKKTGGVDAPLIAKIRRVEKREAGIKKRSSFRGWQKMDGTPKRNPHYGKPQP